MMGKKSYRNDYRFVTETGQICTDFSVICNACNDSHPITYVTYMYYRSVICNTENFLYYRLYNPDQQGMHNCATASSTATTAQQAVVQFIDSCVSG